MKRILLILALVASAQLANAQKTAADYVNELASKKAACENPKKSAKPATWLSLAKTAMAAYAAPKGDAEVGYQKQNVEVLMMGVKPISTTKKTISNNEYTVDSYANCDYYYNSNNLLALMVVTKPYVDDALEVALAAYSKAAEVDPTGSKTKEIKEGISAVATSYENEAGVAYSLGDLAKSSVLFEKAAAAAYTAPNYVVDSSSLYNAAITAYMCKDYQRSKQLFENCIKFNHFNNGDTYARLAECQSQLKEFEEAKATLEEGFSVFPSNQGIIVGLINVFMETKDDPNKLFALLDQAKINEPNNASLYYVEGNVCKQLGMTDKALAAYAKCSEVDPNYEYGYIGEAQVYLEQAEEIRAKAETEFNDHKYQQLVRDFEEVYLKAVAPFERAYEISNNPTLKRSLADYLKNIYYRFRDKGPEFQAGYDRYNEISKNGEQ